MGDLIPCLYARDVGFVRATKCLRILETEREFIAARRAENTRIIDSVFAIFNCFFAKVKEFEFIFDFKSEKVSQMMSKMNFDKLKRQILKIKKARDEKETVFFKDRLQTGLFVVDCSDLKRKLDLQIATVIETLINQLKEMISADNDKLAQEIDDIGASLSRQVNNLDELEVLRTEAQQIELVLENIRKKIDVIMKKMEMADELYYQMPYEDFKTSWKSMEFPNKIRERAQRTLMRLDKREKELGDLLKADQLDLDLDMGKIALEFDRLNKIDDLEKTDYASKEFVELKVRLDNAIEKSQKIQNGERIMNLPKLTDYSNLHEFKKTFSPFNQFWEYASNYQYRFLTSLENQLADIDRTLFTVEITETWNDLFKMEKNEFKTNTQMLNLCKQLRAKYNTLKPYIPLVNDLKNDNLKNRHWKDIMNILKIEGEVSEVQKITLRTILDKGAMEYRDEIKDISEIASKESGFVRLLSSLRQDWKNINFEISEFRNTGRFILKNVDPITDKLDEDIAKLSSILSSPYVKFLENDIVLERTILIQNQETIEIWIKVQKHWQYLQPIFSSEDIIKQRPNEALKFQNIEKLFHSIIDSSRNNPAVPECCKIQKIFENLTYCFQLAEEIIKSLNDYLNTKRVAFPRFYFLPNEELLTILAQTKDVRMIQKFLNKCFEGLEVLTFSEDNIITHMNSIHGEALLLSDQINPFEEPGVPRNVEEWLSEVEVAMKTTLHDYFKKSLESFKDMSKSTWLLSWPGQIVTAISQTLWTSEVESSLLLMKENQGALAEAYKFQKAKLMEIVKVMQEGSLSKRDTQTFEVLIVMEVHGLDVIEDLEKNKVQGKDLFEWTSQLRYYWEYHEKEKKHRLNLRMIITERQYGWEYLGNQGRLVITPLTDRLLPDPDERSAHEPRRRSGRAGRHRQD
jgi:dynein heavy chain